MLWLTVYLTLEARCRINRCRYNRVGLYFGATVTTRYHHHHNQRQHLGRKGVEPSTVVLGVHRIPCV
jgi:hypothetical protein